MKRLLLFLWLLLPFGVEAFSITTISAHPTTPRQEYAIKKDISYLHGIDTLRVLAIGNSFSEDAIEQNLWELLDAAGIPAIVANMYIGGCSLERHYNNSVADAPAYRYRKIIGGKTTERQGVRISEALADEAWTHISLQQVSGYSGLYGTYEPYLTELIRYIQARTTDSAACAVEYTSHYSASVAGASVCNVADGSATAPVSAGSTSCATASSAPILLFHQTWAYSCGSNHPDFPLYDCNQSTMYKQIVSSVSSVLAEHPQFTLLVPSGTAIQNARTSSLGDTFNRDGFHLNFSYGRYTAACAWFAALTGLKASENNWKPSTIDENTAAICRKAADLAVANPLQVSSVNCAIAPETASISSKTTDQYRQERCKLDVYYPKGKKGFKTIVWFHGGGLVEGEKYIPEQLTGKGIAVVAVNYRLSPKSLCPAYIRDAAAAVAWTFAHIAEYGGDPGQIYVSGHSAGGYLALMLAMDKTWLATEGVDADAVAGYYPISGQTVTHYAIRSERGLSTTTPLIDTFAPIGNVRVLGTKLILYTGERSKELMARYEENMYLKAVLEGIGNPTIPLFEFSGTDHGTVLTPAFAQILKDMGC